MRLSGDIDRIQGERIHGEMKIEPNVLCNTHMPTHTTDKELGVMTI